MTPRVSLTVTNFSWPGGPAAMPCELERLARRADEGGLDTLWVSDHLLQGEPGTEPTQEMLEAYGTLSFLAATTSRIRLGTLVTANTFRPPALLIKAVTTLDVLSRGRAWFGIGAGYHQGEADMMGLPLPPVPERFERLDDTLALARRMWSGDDSAFVGHHHRLTRPISSPQPVGTPRILVGGTGEQRTLKLVARYADACNLFDIPDAGATIRRKLDVLAGHCAAIGRPFEQIEKTVSTRLGPTETPTEFARRCETLAGYGIDHVITLTAGPWTADAVSRLVAANRALGGD